MSDQKRYTLDNVVIRRYDDGMPHKVKQRCKAWTSGLTMDRDNEPGDDADGTWDWVTGNAMVCDYLNTGPEDCRGIYYVFELHEPGTNIDDTGSDDDHTLGAIIGQFGMPHDDRKSARNAGLTDAYTVWGGIVVDHKHRERGLFTLIINYMDMLMQWEATRLRKTLVAYLSADEPNAVSGYERFGFVGLDMEVHNEFFDEPLYRNEYTPIAA